MNQPPVGTMIYRSWEEAHAGHQHCATAELRRMEDNFARFSLARALRMLSNGEAVDGFEGAVSQAFSGGDRSIANQFASTFTVPWGTLSVGRRDLQTTLPSAGGSMVGYSVGPAADVLRPYSVAVRTGMSVWSGLNTDVGVPSVFDEVTFQWLDHESSVAPSVQPVVNLAQMRPHVASGLITFSGKLLRMTQPGFVDAFLRRRLALAAGQLIDRMVLQGRTLDPAEPLGLLNIAGLQRYTVAPGAELATGINPAMTYVANEIGSDGGAAFVLGTSMREALLPKDTADRGVLRNDVLQGRPAHCTSAMVSASAAYGDFGASALGLYGAGVEIAVDPFTGFKNDTISMRCMVIMDCAFPCSGAFAVVDRT